MNRYEIIWILDVWHWWIQSILKPSNLAQTSSTIGPICMKWCSLVVLNSHASRLKAKWRSLHHQELGGVVHLAAGSHQTGPQYHLWSMMEFTKPWLGVGGERDWTHVALGRDKSCSCKRTWIFWVDSHFSQDGYVGGKGKQFVLRFTPITVIPRGVLMDEKHNMQHLMVWLPKFPCWKDSAATLCHRFCTYEARILPALWSFCRWPSWINAPLTPILP